jgi:hypothetical protein
MAITLIKSGMGAWHCHAAFAGMTVFSATNAFDYTVI